MIDKTKDNKQFQSPPLFVFGVYTTNSNFLELQVNEPSYTFYRTGLFEITFYFKDELINRKGKWSYENGKMYFSINDKENVEYLYVYELESYPFVFKLEKGVGDLHRTLLFTHDVRSVSENY